MGWGGTAATTCPDRCVRARSPVSSLLPTSGSCWKGFSGAHASSARIPPERFFFIQSDVAEIWLHVLREYNPVSVNDDEGGIIRRLNLCSASVLPLTVALYFISLLQSNCFCASLRITVQSAPSCGYRFLFRFNSPLTFFFFFLKIRANNFHCQPFVFIGLN